MTTYHLQTDSVQLALHLRPDIALGGKAAWTIAGTPLHHVVKLHFLIRQKAHVITRQYVISKSPFADAEMWSVGELCFYKFSVEIICKNKNYFSWWLDNKTMLPDGKHQWATQRVVTRICYRHKIVLPTPRDLQRIQSKILSQNITISSKLSILLPT